MPKGSSGSGRTQNESRKSVVRVSGSELTRAVRGGQRGNRNAVKSLPWLEEYDLSTPEGVKKFLAEVVKKTWSGELGTRAASALNGSIRLMFEHGFLPEVVARIEELEKAKQR